MKSSRVQHMHDFLVIRADQLLLEESRDEGRLKRLVDKYPNRFRLEDGAWRFSEAEARLGELGIAYRIRATQEHPAQFVRNVDFLAYYYDRDCPPVTGKELQTRRGHFADCHVWSLSDLIDATKETVPPESIHKAIDDDHVAFELYDPNTPLIIGGQGRN